MKFSFAGTRLIQSQLCMQYRGIFFDKLNADAKTGDLKEIHNQFSKLCIFLRCKAQFFQYLLLFAFNVMHDPRAMNVTHILAPRYKGHSLSTSLSSHNILYVPQPDMAFQPYSYQARPNATPMDQKEKKGPNIARTSLCSQDYENCSNRLTFSL